MELKVAAKSKFGVLDAITNKWMNPLQKSLLTTFELGKAYAVTIEKTKGDDGKVRDYITKASEVKASVIEKPRIKAEEPKQVEAKPSDKGLSFGEKDARILVQGVVQAVLQSPLMNMIPDGVLPMKFLEQTTADVCAIVKKLSGTK